MPRKANDAAFEALTWFDIESWAGPKILARGKSYQRSGTVKDLVVTKDKNLVAWVDGSSRYATRVWFKNKELTSSCTCPFGSTCKHAVAVILEYLQQLKQKKDVPLATQNDKRLNLLENPIQAYPNDDWDDFDEPEQDASPPGRSSARKKSRRTDDVENFLHMQSKEKLLELITDMITDHPEIKQEMEYTIRMASHSVSTLSKTISKEIDMVNEEPGWYDHWNHKGSTPDYSRVKSGLVKLLAAGHTDEIVKLGHKLFKVGIRQVEQSDDEGATAGQVAETLNIVFKGLRLCSFPDVDKMEQTVDYELADDYALCEGIEEFWKHKFKPKTWSDLADRLLLRLQAVKHNSVKDSFSRDYQRDRLTDHIINALEQAGRKPEIIPLCIQEIPKTHNFERLVKHLRKAGRNDEAEQWIRKGISATQEKWPGIASALRKELLDIHVRKRDWLFVAAIRAEEFFENPCLDYFLKLQKASEKAQAWPLVHSVVMNFLETGQAPFSGKTQNGKNGWPLPNTALTRIRESRWKKPPYTEVIIEIALHEKKVEGIIKWYDIHSRKKYSFGYWGSGIGNLDDRVASAFSDPYPDKAIEIWKRMAETHISRTKPSEYALAVGYLRKIKKLLTQKDCIAEWRKYAARLQENNIRKIRFIEMLHSLEGKPIVELK